MATVKFSALANTTVIATAIVYGFLLRLAAAAGIAGLLLRVLVTLSLLRYSYAVLRHVASGWQKFPPPDIESTNPFDTFTVVLHSVLFGALLYFLATTPFVDLWLRWPLLLVVLVVFPASAAIMAMTRNAAAALNPAGIASVIRDLGADYGKLLGVSLLLGALLAVGGVLTSLSWFLGVFDDMLAAWTMLALFLAIGATLRARRDDFDLLEAVDDAEQRETKQRHSEWQKTLDRAYGSVRSGLTAQGYRTVKELIEDQGDSLEIYQWAFNGMLAWDEPEHAVLLGERFAARLWQAGRKIDALELAQHCRKLSPKFAPPASFLTELVEYARSLGRHRLADELSAR